MGGIANSYAARQHRGLQVIQEDEARKKQQVGATGVQTTGTQGVQTTGTQGEQPWYTQNIYGNQGGQVDTTLPPLKMGTGVVAPGSGDTTDGSISHPTLPTRTKVSGMGDIIDEVKRLGYSMETDEEKAKRIKNENLRKLRASITDGLRALASAYYVNKGGLPTYDPTNSGLSKVEAEVKESDAKRRADKQAWQQAVERAMARKTAEAQAEDAWKWKAYDAEVAQAMADRQQKNWQTKFDFEKQQYGDAKDYREWQKGQTEKEFAHKQRVDNETLKINREKMRRAVASGGTSSGNSAKLKLATAAGWAKLYEISQTPEGKDLAERMRTAGNPKFDSRGKATGAYYAPTEAQKLELIMQYGESQQVFDEVFSGKGTYKAPNYATEKEDKQSSADQGKKKNPMS